MGSGGDFCYWYYHIFQPPITYDTIYPLMCDVLFWVGSLGIPFPVSVSSYLLFLLIFPYEIIPFEPDSPIFTFLGDLTFRPYASFHYYNLVILPAMFLSLWLWWCWRVIIKPENRKMVSLQNNDSRGRIIGDSYSCQNYIIEILRYIKICLTS